MVTFYDRSGIAIAYSDDDVHIYLISGQACCYLDGAAVFSYSGALMGWFENGWIRDKDGRCVVFSESATGGPPRPTKQAMPEKRDKQLRPPDGKKDPKPLRPIHSNAWSDQPASAFFSHLPHHWPGFVAGTTTDGKKR